MMNGQWCMWQRRRVSPCLGGAPRGQVWGACATLGAIDQHDPLMNKITLQLDINEVNILIKALSERPFREVYELIGKIHAQSNTQLPGPTLQPSKAVKAEAERQ